MFFQCFVKDVHGEWGWSIIRMKIILFYVFNMQTYTHALILGWGNNEGPSVAGLSLSVSPYYVLCTCTKMRTTKRLAPLRSCPKSVLKPTFTCRHCARGWSGACTAHRNTITDGVRNMWKDHKPKVTRLSSHAHFFALWMACTLCHHALLWPLKCRETKFLWWGKHEPHV